MSTPEHATFPNGWSHTKLSEFITLESGLRPQGGVKGILEGVPSLGGEHLNNKGKFHFNKMKYMPEEFFASLNQGHICPNDILVVKDGATTGKTSFIDEDFPYEHAAVNEHLFIIRVVSKGALPKFVFYYLFSNKGQASIRLDFRGATVGGISRNFSTKVEIPLPPLPEQHRIVAKIEELFTKLDAGINELHKAQSQLKRYRQSVLKAAFEGKLTEAWRAEDQEEIEPASVLLKRILKERREKWETEQLEQMRAKGKMPKDDKWKAKYKEPVAPDTNDLPELPKGWTWATVEQLLTKIQYGSSKKTDDDSNGVPVLRMGNIVDGKIVLDNLKYLPKKHDEFPELLLDKGDLLFNRTNSRELVGKTAVYTGIPNLCSFASYLIRVRFNPRIDSMIVAYYINSVYGKDWILSVVSQLAGQANVNGTKLKLLAVPMPSEKEQQVLVEEVEHRFSVADEVEKTITAELKRAEQLRQSILKKAFSGELVPQDPNDEPASALLERIKVQKEIVF